MSGPHPDRVPEGHVIEFHHNTNDHSSGPRIDCLACFTALLAVAKSAEQADTFIGRAKAKIEGATGPLTDGDCHELLSMLSAAMWPLRTDLAALAALPGGR